jgi:glutathione S-transferase
MSEASLLTAGRYGFGARRIHRDDFAKVLAALLPGDGMERTVPTLTPAPRVIEEAARVCRHLAARYEGEPLGRISERVAYSLVHPVSRGGPGELLFYATALLCREQEAAAAVEEAASVEAVLEHRAAQRVADVLEPIADTSLRYAIQTSFDGDFVRSTRRLSMA